MSSPIGNNFSRGSLTTHQAEVPSRPLDRLRNQAQTSLDEEDFEETEKIVRQILKIMKQNERI